MKPYLNFGFTLLFATLVAPYTANAVDPIESPVKSNFQKRTTAVNIAGDRFHINGKPTYEGRQWNGERIEGLLLNSRMVQATFDDRSPDTASKWAYADTKKWDADRNTAEFVEMMPVWRKHRYC